MITRSKQIRWQAFTRPCSIVGMLLLISVYAGAGCGKQGQSAPSRPPPPEVRVAEVVQQDVPIYYEWLGTTEGYVNAQIRPRVQGYLQSQNYKEGSLVKAGDLLFVIDPREYQAALDQAIGALGQAEATLRKTQLDVARFTPLAKEGAISQQELDNAVQANQANQASVEAARAAVANAKLNLGWTKVTAPISGIAGISVAQIGDLVTPNTLLTTISQVDPIKVYYPISEQEYLHFARRIREIDEGRGGRRPPLELILADGSLYPERGEFTLADRQVNVQTGTITMQGLFPNPGNILRPGLYAKVRVAPDVQKGALLIPQRAVQELQGVYQVAVVGPDNVVQIRLVKPGQRVGSQWIIEEGLQPGERVVAEGLQKVRDGLVVSPQPVSAESDTTQVSASVAPAAASSSATAHARK